MGANEIVGERDGSAFDHETNENEENRIMKLRTEGLKVLNQQCLPDGDSVGEMLTVGWCESVGLCVANQEELNGFNQNIESK